jgi:hypothetical protein
VDLKQCCGSIPIWTGSPDPDPTSENRPDPDSSKLNVSGSTKSIICTSNTGTCYFFYICLSDILPEG